MELTLLRCSANDEFLKALESRLTPLFHSIAMRAFKVSGQAKHHIWTDLTALAQRRDQATWITWLFPIRKGLGFFVL